MDSLSLPPLAELSRSLALVHTDTQVHLCASLLLSVQMSYAPLIERDGESLTHHAVEK